jgi:hypothetical protein
MENIKLKANEVTYIKDENKINKTKIKLKRKVTAEGRKKNGSPEVGNIQKTKL